MSDLAVLVVVLLGTAVIGATLVILGLLIRELDEEQERTE